MAVNVNKGPAAQDFKIEIIVISASMHKVFKEFSQGFSIVRILFLHLFIKMFVNLDTCHAAQDFKVVTDNTGLAAHDLPTIKISLVHGLMLTF